MLYSRVHRAKIRKCRFDFLGCCVRRNIVIGRHFADKHITHTASDNMRRVAALAESV